MIINAAPFVISYIYIYIYIYSHSAYNIFLVYVILNLYIIFSQLLYSNYHFHLFSLCFAFPSEILTYVYAIFEIQSEIKLLID